MVYMGQATIFAILAIKPLRQSIEQVRAMKSCRYKAGATLIEMLVVVAVIAILVTIVLSVATGIQNQGNERLTENTFGLLEGALEEYHDYTGEFPVYPVGTLLVERSETLYGALNSIPSSRKILEDIDGTLIQNEPLTADTPEIYDPWGTVLDYIYVAGDTFPTLISAGPDKDFLTAADNITNR